MSDRIDFERPSWRPEQRQAGLDPDMRRMALMASGFGVVLALVIGGLSLTRHASHGIPVIAAPSGPVRVKPADPGGMQVLGSDQVAPGAEKLSPPAEQPELHALHARLKAARLAAHPAVVAEAHTQTAIAPPAPMQRASATQAVALAAPPPLAVNAAPPSGTMVQLAAFDTQAAAEQDWGRLAEKMPELFHPKKPDIVRADVAGRAVWRLRTGGFVTLASAVEFCTAVRARGGDCSVAAF